MVRGAATAAVPGGAAGTPPTGGRFRGDIEGLRAVAVGLVVLDHVVGWPTGGFIGVDVFFVISGFLITGLLVRERARTGRISFRAFYVRRVRRLMPAAVTTLVVTTAVAWLIFVSGRARQTVTDAVWALLFGSNINSARQGTDYFQLTAAPSPFQHFWSLAVEEQFYLVWPMLILAVFAVPLARGRTREPVLVCAIIGVAAASFAWSVHATAVSPATAYFSTFTRAWELAVGAAVAVLAARLDRVPDALRGVLAWAGLAGVVVSACWLTSRTPFPGSAAALPVLSAAALIAFGSAPGGPGVRWALGSPPARFLGRISYSLYLWHWPVVVVLGSLVAPGTRTAQIAAVLISLFLATVSYHVIEQPVLHSNWLQPGRRRQAGDVRVRQQARRVGLAAFVVGSAAAVTAALVVPTGRVDPTIVAAADAALAAAQQTGGDAPAAALDPLAQEIETATFSTEWGTLDPALGDLPDYLHRQWSAGCFDIDAATVDSCSSGDPDAPHRAVVLGDSIAGAWLPGIEAALEPQGWAVQPLGMGQCPNITALTLADDKPFTACAQHRDWALDYIDQTKPDLVVLSNVYTAELVDAQADRPAVWRAGLTSIVTRVQQSGARVVLLSSPPGTANLQTCATALSRPADCATAPSATWQTYSTIEADVAAATHADHVDPLDWFCLHDLCPAVVGSTPVYADGVHLTAEYATKISAQLGAALLGTGAPAAPSA